MQQENTHKNTTNLTYCPTFETDKNYLMKVDKKFIQDFDNCSQIVIKGDKQTQPVLKFGQNCYKLKLVNMTTTNLIVSNTGIILQQTSNYLNAHKFNPSFNKIYQNILSRSCFDPHKQNITNNNQLISSFSFSKSQIKKQQFLSESNFVRLVHAMKLITINSLHAESQESEYLYIPLQFSVWIMRQIIKTYNQNNNNLMECMQTSVILTDINVLNYQIFLFVLNKYQFVPCETNQGRILSFKMSIKSILRYIFQEMSLAKKQYSSNIFEQTLEQLILVYMPAESGISLQKIKENPQFWQCRFEYFIKTKDQKYKFYDYMKIQTDISERLKFLANIKSRWASAELKNLFRGIDSTQSGKFLNLSDILLRKFRRYGQQYQLKFVIPNK